MQKFKICGDLDISANMDVCECEPRLLLRHQGVYKRVADNLYIIYDYGTRRRRVNLRKFDNNN